MVSKVFILAIVSCGVACAALDNSFEEPLVYRSQGSLVTEALKKFLKAPTPVKADGFTDVLGHIEDFMRGMYYGLQANPSSISECVKSFDPLEESSKELLQKLQAIYVNKNPQYAIESIISLNEMVKDLVSFFDLCGVEILMQKLSNIPTRDGFGELVLEFGLNYDDVLDTAGYFAKDFSDGDYSSSGVDLGKIMRMLLKFSL